MALSCRSVWTASFTDQLYYRKKKEADRNEIRLAAIFDSDLILGEEVDWEGKSV